MIFMKRLPEKARLRSTPSRCIALLPARATFLAAGRTARWARLRASRFCRKNTGANASWPLAEKQRLHRRRPFQNDPTRFGAKPSEAGGDYSKTTLRGLFDIRVASAGGGGVKLRLAAAALALLQLGVDCLQCFAFGQLLHNGDFTRHTIERRLIKLPLRIRL